MKVLVTGAAGFIGMHTCLRLLERGDEVVGIDEINDYYDPRLKEARLARLTEYKNFHFVKADIADRAAMAEVAAKHQDISRLLNLAAQAGVRYSLINPYAYTHANVEGLLVLLEMARNLPKCEHFAYASSSSVYGSNKKMPFSVEDRVDNPISLYAATKKAGELMAHTYSHLFRIPTTGLRFFTVYGPWGRPDMAAYLFASAILKGEPIHAFNGGDMFRDFTYIDDIVAGVLAVIDNAPPDNGAEPPYRLYNIGNNQTEHLMRYIQLIEETLGRKAETILEPMQPGDVKETYADITAIQRDLGYQPTTTIDVGVPKFIEWFKWYHKM
jgi:UDP-glucuronate 4-epimerase